VLRGDGGVGRIDLHEAGFALLNLLGEKLGGAALRVAAGVKPMPSPTVALRRDSLEVEASVYTSRTPPAGPVATFAYQPNGKTAFPLVLLQLRELVLVGVQPELSAIVGAQIRADSPYRHTMVATMVDGAAKYLPDRQGFERYTYEARSSPYVPGTAELVARAIHARLELMHHENIKD